jgi:outer membrane protein assembly factor BamB
MSVCLPPAIRTVRRAPGWGAHAVAIALTLLLPLLAACGAPRAPGLDTTIYAGSSTGAVSALDAATGKVLWRYHPYGVQGLAVDPVHQKLFLTSPDGSVAALNATTGKLDWQYTIGSGDWMNKPYLIGSMVIAVAQQVPGGLTDSSVIVALDAGSGAPLWRVSLPGAITGDLNIHNDRIYASVDKASAHDEVGPTGPGAIYALRTTDGTQVWRATAPAALVAGPASDQTQVYASTSVGTALALRASDGALQWNQNIGASGYLSAILAYSTAVYVGDGDGIVRALNKSDGAVLWTQTIPNSTTVIGPRVYTPSDGGAQVLVTSTNTTLIYALSPNDGSVVWSQESPGGDGTQPLFVLGDYIYLSSHDEIAVITLAHGAYAADYPVFLTSSGYTPAEQADLSNIAFIVAAPPRVAT